MPIPETQLDTWSHQGSVAQSSVTYQTIKRALESDGTNYSGRDFLVFLQGSYGNDTNTFAESDVDIVIRLDSTFNRDLTALTPLEVERYHSSYASASYTYDDFHADVVQVLKNRFGSDVDPGSKAIKIHAGSGRRNADVIIATEFRRYQRFSGLGDQSYISGIRFRTSSGEYLVNYPKQHSANCTAKHQRTSSWFKPTVRILKNMRRRLVDTNIIPAGTAPSYFIEGLLYNVPDACFGGSYHETFVSSYNWLLSATREELICANEQYRLLGGSSVNWPTASYELFMNAVEDLWNDW